MNNDDIRVLINLISKSELEVIKSPNFKEITNHTSKLSEMGIDSLEYMMLYMHLGELFGIDKERFKDLEVLGDVQLRTITDFLQQQDTRNLSIEEAKSEYLKDR
jgi:acyl carrier protein